jgi:WD40 repeat protein
VKIIPVVLFAVMPLIAVPPENVITSLSTSSDGSILAAGYDNGSVVAYDWKQDSVVFSVQAHEESTENVCFRSDSLDYLLTCSTSGKTKLWNVASGKKVYALKHPGTVHTIQFTSGIGDRFFSGGSDGTIYHWNTSNGNLLGRYKNPNEAGILVLAPANKYEWVAAGYEDGTVSVWNTDKGEIVHCFTHKRVTSLVFSPDDKYLVIGEENGRLTVRDLDNDIVFRSHRKLKREVTYLTFSPDGDWLYSGYENGSIYFWEYRYELRPSNRPLEYHKKDISEIVFINDNNEILTVSLDGQISVLNGFTLGLERTYRFPIPNL